MRHVSTRPRGLDGRPWTTVGLAAALLFASWFVDVGVARAEYPAGWDDPDLGQIGACIASCGALFALKAPFSKYAFGAMCVDCALDLGIELVEWIDSVDWGTCYTGVNGEPCSPEDRTW